MEVEEVEFIDSSIEESNFDPKMAVARKRQRSSEQPAMNLGQFARGE